MGTQQNHPAQGMSSYNDMMSEYNNEASQMQNEFNNEASQMGISTSGFGMPSGYGNMESQYQNEANAMQSQYQNEVNAMQSQSQNEVWFGSEVGCTTHASPCRKAWCRSAHVRCCQPYRQGVRVRICTRA